MPPPIANFSMTPSACMRLSIWKTFSMNVYLSSQQIESLPSGFDRLIDDRVRMRSADKRGFELRRRQVNSFIQHRVKKLAVEFTVALVGRSPVCDRLLAEETSPHRTNPIRRSRSEERRVGK